MCDRVTPVRPPSIIQRGWNSCSKGSSMLEIKCRFPYVIFSHGCWHIWTFCFGSSPGILVNPHNCVDFCACCSCWCTDWPPTVQVCWESHWRVNWTLENNCHSPFFDYCSYRWHNSLFLYAKSHFGRLFVPWFHFLVSTTFTQTKYLNCYYIEISSIRQLCSLIHSLTSHKRMSNLIDIGWVAVK